MSPRTVNPAADPTLDYDSAAYKSAYSRINGLVIEAEQEAHRNYLTLAELLPQQRAEFLQAARMERRHQRGFQTCGNRLGVGADRDWARALFAELHREFANAAAEERLLSCLLIQCLVAECLAIAIYQTYLPVADSFSRPIVETVLQDEHRHLKLGQTWFKSHFKTIKAELQAESRRVLPLAWDLLAGLGTEAARLGIDLEALAEEFTIQYGEALEDIGFSFQEVARLSTDAALVA